MGMVNTEARTERMQGRWLGLAALSLSGLVLGLDITVLVTALPTLSARLGATTDQLQWMSAAYTLSLAGFMLPAGVLGDRFGRRRLLLLALVAFGLSSVAASQVTTANGLIAMRAVMGVSGAVILPLMQGMLPVMFAPDERQRALGFAGAGAFLGLPLGPLVAGFLLNHYSWGSIFLINGPVVVLALIGTWFFVPESKDPNPRRLDWLGAVLEVVGVTAVVYAIIEEPVRGWGNPQVYAPLVGGAVLLAAFVLWELRVKFPLVDLNLFRSARFSWATVAFIVVGFGMTGVLFIISPFLQVVQGNDAQATGAATAAAGHRNDGRGDRQRLAEQAPRHEGDVERGHARRRDLDAAAVSRHCRQRLRPGGGRPRDHGREHRDDDDPGPRRDPRCAARR